MPQTTKEMGTAGRPQKTEAPEKPKDDGKCKDGFSQPQAIGIGVGAAIAGIALTIAAFVLFFRFKYRQRRKPNRILSLPAISPTKTSHTETNVSYARNAIDDLPQRNGNREYRQQLEGLRSDIKNFTESFFPGSHTLSEAQEAEIKELAGPLVHNPSLIATLSDPHPSIRQRAIRSLIARMLFNRIDPRTQMHIPLLPPTLFAVYQSLAYQPEKNRHRRTQSLGIESDRNELIATWRRITGAYLPRDLILHQRRLSVEEIASGLAHLQPDQHDNFQHVLQDLGEQAARLGLSLFTLPEQWSAIWTSEGQHNSGNLVVFPGVQLNSWGKAGSKRLAEPYLE